MVPGSVHKNNIMGFTESITTCLTKKYATFSGRASRSEYWWFYLFLTIGPAIIIGLLYSIFDTAGVVIGILAVLGLIVPNLAVLVRRLHDTNHSGWWFFISAVPMIGGLWLLFLLVSAGTPGDNKYGPNPLEA